MIYLDNAATTLQKPVAVSAAVCAALRTCANPGRGGHAAAMHAAQVLAQTRQEAALLFDAAPEQVVFTMNATHGLNLAIHTLVHPGDRVVISGFEHNAVMRPLCAMGAEIITASRTLFSPEKTLEDFTAAVTADTAAVIVNHCSNVFGYVQPLEEIAALCRERNVPLVVDASQSAGTQKLSLHALGASFIAMPGHKSLYGPQGTGLLLCRTLPKPLLFGGTGSLSLSEQMPDFLPDRAEAGTLNVHGLAGLREGLRFVRRVGTERILCGEQKLRKRLCVGLGAIGSVQVFDGGETQAGVVSFVPSTDCEELAEAYAQRGIAVRAGLHCAPAAHRSGGTLETGTVRVSLSWFTQSGEIDRFLEETERILKKRQS